MTARARTERATLLAQLPQPSRAYKRRVWLAVLGLGTFITLYFVLAGWFLYTAYRLTLGADTADFAGILVGACALFLAVMMLKGLFYVKHGDTSDSVELKKEQQPRLFAFLYELADAAEAPRPHRVFVSPRVNAAVFYDLSPLNLVFPSKKNLEIGLPLVNALSLGELRAVLAHEFGHFSQRSMAVMRWTYLAQQIAAHLVARRDKLDELLVQLSHLDVRIAWLGWLLSLIVWSIRSLVDSAFSVVVLLQRALSREMEFQADLVSVALSGSDALIHALHRLQAADDSWDRTLGLVGEQHAKGRLPRDVFPLHAHVMQRMGEILSDPEYGRVPPVPAQHPEKHRLFKAELAQPPRMWLTHPLNHEREANAKQSYVNAPIDERSAWELFDDPAAVREQVSRVMLESADKETVPVEESLAAIDEQFGREYLNSRYRGVYLGRSMVRSAGRPEDLVEAAPVDWRGQLDALYPESLTQDVARLRTLEKELDQLRALQSGVLKPAEGVIRHRSRVIKRRDLPRVIQRVEKEVAVIERRLSAGDRVRRSVHLAAATELDGAWAPYLKGLLAAAHYGDHTSSNLRDLQGVLAHAVQMATATSRVSAKRRRRVLEAANELHAALSDVFAQATAVTLDSSLTERLGAAGWTEVLGTFELPPADDENIGQWLSVIDGWVNQAAGACGALRGAAIEQLLVTEAAIAAHVRDGTPPGEAPAPSTVPGKYAVLLTGKERERESTLNWWERFQIADGVVPTVARVAAAATIVAAVLGFGGTVGTATITVYNGLALPVVVHIGVEQFPVPAFGWHAQSVDAAATYRIETRTRQGKVIESFTPEIPGSFANFVYNVGGATPLVHWTAVYGNAKRRPEQMLGAPRWTRTSATVLFEKPPESVKTSGGGATRQVLSGFAEVSPGQQLALHTDSAERRQAILAHARWDATSSAHIVSWLMMAQSDSAAFAKILAARLAESPNDVVLRRHEQDAAEGAAKDSVCAHHRARAEAAPDNADLHYLATRCVPESAAQEQAYRDGYARWPDNGWFANAAGFSYAEVGDWRRALAPLEQARARIRPLAGHLAVDLARIHRIAEDDSTSAAAIAGLAKLSDELNYYATLETGEGWDSTAMLAYAELASGDLDAALQAAHADSSIEARVLRLAAASDGASAELQKRALALAPTAGFDESTRWASIALAIRAGVDHAPLLHATPSGRPIPKRYLEPMSHFIELLRTGKSLATADQTLNGLPPALRGQAYTMGVVLLGAKAPPAWRHGAKRLLFSSERPYFQ